MSIFALTSAPILAASGGLVDELALPAAIGLVVALVLRLVLRGLPGVRGGSDDVGRLAA